jgi:uncharacterized membrane protein
MWLRIARLLGDRDRRAGPPPLRGSNRRGRPGRGRCGVRCGGGRSAGRAPRSPVSAPVRIPPPQPAVSPRANAATSTAPTRSIEAEIGSRWLLWVGVIAIVIGAAYFQRLAMEHGWIDASARVVQGAIAGLLLVFAGRKFIKAGYALYGQMVAGAGFAVLYVSVYAASAIYQLVAPPVDFALMCAVTGLTAWFANRYRAQALALLGVGGGFATPFLLPSQTDAQVALFTYDAVLIAGTMYLAHRRIWPVLNVVSYALTALTLLAWAVQFYDSTKYLTTELFLTLYCAMYVYILAQSARSDRPVVRISRAILWTAPAAYHLASIAVLMPHPGAMLVYLMSAAIAGAVAGARFGSLARLIAWVAVAAPLLIWVGLYAREQWLTRGLAAIATIHIIQLISHFEASPARGRRIPAVDVALLHLNGLVSFAGALYLLTVLRPSWRAGAAAGFAVWHAGIAAAIAHRNRDHALQFVAVAATLLVIAIGLQFEGYAVTMGWGAEGAGLIALGLRERRNWLRAGGTAVFGMAVLQLLNLQTLARWPSYTPLLNARTLTGGFLTVLAYAVAWGHDRDSRRDDAGAALAVAQLLLLSIVVAEINAWQAADAGIGMWRINRAALHGLACALAAVRLVMIGSSRRAAWMRGLGFAVLAIGLLRLADAWFATTPAAGYVPVFNMRLLAGGGCIAACYGLAALYRRTPLDDRWKPRLALLYAANLLTLAALTVEITAYWETRAAAAGVSADRGDQLAQQMMVSIAWAVYATGLIVFGIRRRTAALRYLAIGVFAATILKVFLNDLSNLDEIYRVSSIVALGVALLVTSFLYHRFRTSLSD